MHYFLCSIFFYVMYDTRELLSHAATMQIVFYTLLFNHSANWLYVCRRARSGADGFRYPVRWCIATTSQPTASPTESATGLRMLRCYHNSVHTGCMCVRVWHSHDSVHKGQGWLCISYSCHSLYWISIIAKRSVWGIFVNIFINRKNVCC